MMPAAVLAVVSFHLSLIKQRVNLLCQPAVRYLFNEIEQQIPVAAVVETQHVFRLARELIEPGQHLGAQRVAREHPIRKLPELG